MTSMLWPRGASSRRAQYGVLIAVVAVACAVLVMLALSTAGSLR